MITRGTAIKVEVIGSGTILKGVANVGISATRYFTNSEKLERYLKMINRNYSKIKVTFTTITLN